MKLKIFKGNADLNQTITTCKITDAGARNKKLLCKLERKTLSITN
jgi:hypothetical protein